MADPVIVNNPNDKGSGAGFVIGVLVVIVIVILFFLYALPYLMNRNTNPDINLPEKIQIDTSQP